MDKYFEDSYRRNCRKDMANYFYQNINDPTGQYNHMWAFVIKAFHFTVPIYACLIYLCGPIWLGLFTLVLSICSWSLFMYLKGCFLSNVEYKLNSDNFINIIDPYLVMCGYPITEETRYNGTQYIVLIHFIIAFAILYFRLKMRHFTKN
jgi:hypothetical protein